LASAPFGYLRPSPANIVDRATLRLSWHHDERVWATIGSIFIHAGIVLFLFNFDVRVLAQVNAGAGEVRTFLVFEDIKFAPKLPPSPSATPLSSGKSAQNIASSEYAAPQSVKMPVVARDPGVELRLDGVPETVEITETAGRAALDLSLPEGLVVHQEESFPERKPWERRQALEVESTRFAGEWAPDGDAASDLAWRYKSAAFLMSVFGGGAKPCTSDERRQRHPRLRRRPRWARQTACHRRSPE